MKQWLIEQLIVSLLLLGCMAVAWGIVVVGLSVLGVLQMMLENEVGYMLAVFKRDPEVSDEYTDEVEQWLMVTGESITPDGLMLYCYDYNGYEWMVPSTEVKNDHGKYGWTTKCYKRVLEGFLKKR